MKKKFLTVLLALVAAFCLCFGLAACGEETPPQDPSISAPSGQEGTENNQDADGEGEEKEPEGEEETNPDEGGGNSDEGGGNPDEGGGNPDEGGGTPEEGGGNPDEGGGNPDEGGSNPDEGGGTPEEGGGNPDEGGGNPDEGGGNPEEGGEEQTCAHEYTAENKCKFCGDEWEHTPFEVFEFTPVTLNGIEGYDACFGQSTAASDEAGSAAFEGDEIVFPYGYNGLPVISIGRFQSCTSDTVKTITVPKSIRSWGNAAMMFYMLDGTLNAEHGSFACKALETLNLPDGLPLPMLEIDYGYGTSTGPRIYQLCAATLFGPSRSAYVCPLWNDPQFREDGALYIGNYLVDAYFEEPVETFTVRNGTKAVLGCYGAENVILPDSVETIGASAFDVMYSGWRNGGDDQPILLKSIDLGEGLRVIGDGAFNSCIGLTSIAIPDSVTEIREWAFCGCIGLTSITIPDGVIKIGEWAFYGCIGLTSITIPDGVTEIGELAFGYCSRLTTIEIPGSVKKIGARAFYGCGLTSIILPEGVTEIGEMAFFECYKLIEVWNYSDLKIVAGDIGNGCIGLCAKYVYTANEKSKQTTTSDGYIFYEDGDEVYLLGYVGNDTQLKLPEKSPSGKNYEIQQGAFYYRIDLTSVEIPNGVTRIGQATFYQCARLTTIIIPDSVTEIGGMGTQGTFYGCRELTAIQFKGTVEEWKAIKKGGFWATETGDYTVTCTDGTVDKKGNVTYFED